MREIGTPVIVRDDMAGVIFGEYAGHSARECHLRNSRKIWEWGGDKRLAVEDVAVVVDPRNKLTKIVPGLNTCCSVCQIVDCAEDVAEYFRTAPATL
jgi:hypothetical protein